MKVSIIIPVYNCFLYIEECLNSIKSQTYTELEIILVDDGSTDNTNKICKKICKEDTRFRYFYQSNQGPSSARNYGLTKVTGDFLTFVDADDLLDENAIFHMVNLSMKWNADLLVCGIETFGAEKTEKILPENGEVHILKSKYISGIASDDKKYGGGFPFAKLWRVSKIKKNDKYIEFDETLRLYEDKLWIIENVKQIESIVLVPTVVYKYRILMNSLSHKDAKWKNEQLLMASKKIMIVSKELCNSSEYINVQNMYAMQLMRVMKVNKDFFDEESKKIVLDAWKFILRSRVIGWKSKLKYIYVCFFLMIGKCDKDKTGQ